jgi:hydroxypyruvate reductase
MKKRPPDQLRRDALQIWQAGVDAVGSECLVRAALRVEGPALVVGDDRLDLAAIRQIAVVGAGKAGAGMAAAVEAVLGPRLMEEKHLAGWINVPEDCVRPLRRIRLHGARPPGVNEPTEAGAAGAEEILRIVRSLGPDDLCLCLISGGGSALMPAPVEGIMLADKLAVTRHLSAAGANIEELNTVRKQLSRIKGGGLARACRARRLISLVISDVLGDPLDTIASGPTVEDTSTPEAALAVLQRFHAHEAGISPGVFEYLKSAAHQARGTAAPACRVTNLIIGNNATAVDAAGREAERLGYAPAMLSAQSSEGLAEEVGVRLAEMAMRMRDRPGPDCLVSGGEPVVKLVEPARRGLGGRNQQLVLAAAEFLWNEGAEGILLLSGGTDGEDGPTAAAGAFLDAGVLRAARERGPRPTPFLARNDAFHFFEPLGALIKTGPTHTNVCDLRVVTVDRIEQ